MAHRAFAAGIIAAIDELLQQQYVIARRHAGQASGLEVGDQALQVAPAAMQVPRENREYSLARRDDNRRRPGAGGNQAS